MYLTFKEGQDEIRRLQAMKNKGFSTKYDGIYTFSQEYARALAEATSDTEVVKAPETHGVGLGYYGHYHEGKHAVHIWYGLPVKWSDIK